jgi:rhomboid protease GluP
LTYFFQIIDKDLRNVHTKSGYDLVFLCFHHCFGIRHEKLTKKHNPFTPFHEPMIELYKHLSRDQAQLCALILTTTGIAYRTKKDGTGWRVRVESRDFTKSLAAMSAYFKENPEHHFVDKKPLSEKLRSFSGIWAAVILMSFYLAVGEDRQVFFKSFGASAAAILNGEAFRTVTALMLHVDAVHLAGNMAAIAFFGSVVGTLHGTGAGWLMILFTGILGNLCNAWLYQTNHLAVGASTAVFGAIGMLSTHQFWNKMAIPGERIKSWLPVAGGMALLGILGSGGGRVDIMAHLFGYLSGIVLETAHRFGVKEKPGKKVQVLCLFILIGIISISWRSGLQ